MVACGKSLKRAVMAVWLASLLPLLLVTSLWVRSYYSYEVVGRTVNLADDPRPQLIRTTGWSLSLNHASAFLTFASYYCDPPLPKHGPSPPQYYRHTGPARLYALRDEPADSYASALGFARHVSAGKDAIDLNAARTIEEFYAETNPPPRLVYRHWSRTVFQVPLWFIAGLSALPAVIGLRSYWRRRRAQYRARRGLCARCGMSDYKHWEKSHA